MAASTIPAEVMTEPVELTPVSMPLRVPVRSASSRTRVIRKMLEEILRRHDVADASRDDYLRQVADIIAAGVEHIADVEATPG